MSKDKTANTEHIEKKDSIYSKVNITLPVLDGVISVGIAILILLVWASL